MRTIKVFQLLGFDPNWICVIHDMLTYNDEKPFEIEVIPNIDMEIMANDSLQTISFKVKKMQDVDRNFPIFFGACSPGNKFRINESFAPYLDKKQYSNLIANSSIVSASCSLNKGIVIDHQSVLGAQTSVGFGVSIKRGAKIAHHNTIGEFTDINPGVITSGTVKIGRGCEIGTGAVINNNITIGDNSFIGMGSVVTKDIPGNSIAYGNPCKVVRPNNLWEI